MAILVATEGPEAGGRYPLETICIIGRSSRCDVRVSDPTVSRQHCRIVREGDQFIIEDLGSGNGTFVNENLVVRHTLRAADEIRIARSKFRFEEKQRRGFSELGHIVTVVDQGPMGGEVPIKDRIDAAQNPLLTREVRATHTRDALVQAYERLRTVYAVAATIGTILDQDELLREILGHMLNAFTQADRGVIMSVDKKTGELVPRTVRRKQGEAEPGEILISRTIVNEVLEKKRAVIFGGDEETSSMLTQGGSSSYRRRTPTRLRAAKKLDPEVVGEPSFVPTPEPSSPHWRSHVTGASMYSMMSAPLLVRGEVLGVIHITSADLATPFERADLDLLVGIATQAAIALQNAEMHAELLVRERLKRDVELAKEIQRRFLPHTPPPMPGWQFAAEYVPAMAIGGDFYDFIPLGPTRIGILIGDVSGKGVSAALLMARITSEFRILAATESEPRVIMAKANSSLASAGYEGLFVTACYVVLDTQARTMTLCNAGHLPPLVRRARPAGLPRAAAPHVAAARPAPVIERLDNACLALGVLDNPSFEQETHTLGQGDVVLMMTDGVVEATNAAGAQLGFEPVQAALAEAAGGAEAALNRVVEGVRTFVGAAPQYDDLTAVCFGLDGGGKRKDNTQPFSVLPE